MLNTEVIDIHCIKKSSGGIPHGYELPNGVVVIWRGNTQNNIYKERALSNFPNLVVVSSLVIHNRIFPVVDQVCDT